jgi:hypothetical protein
MKISAKLRASIQQQISEEGFEYRKILDELDRSDQIPHAIWRRLSEAHISAESNMSTRVLATIANYHR